MKISTRVSNHAVTASLLRSDSPPPSDRGGHFRGFKAFVTGKREGVSREKIKCYDAEFSVSCGLSLLATVGHGEASGWALGVAPPGRPALHHQEPAGRGFTLGLRHWSLLSGQLVRPTDPDLEVLREGHLP